jgi:glucokinase
VNDPLYAGFDLGGTQLKYGLIDGRGALVFKNKAPSPGSIEGLMDLIGDVWKKLRAEYGVRLSSAGFGFAGFFSLKDRKVLHSPNYPSLDGFDLVPALEKVLDAPFRIDNDANMAAYGEWKHGAGRDAHSLVLLTIGTGVGSGIILNGKLWHGRCGFAGEIGHITVNSGIANLLCNCGNHGCLETEVSAPKIVRNYVNMVGSGGELTAEDIYNRAKQGDPAAIESFADCGYYLGIGLGIVINFLNPGMIVLGGGVMAGGEFLMEAAVAQARKRSHRVSFACTTIAKASLANDAGLIGAAAWARDQASRPAS